MKKMLVRLFACTVAIFALGITVLGNSRWDICSGIGEWLGGIQKINGVDHVYSRVRDKYNDGWKVHVRVWAQDDTGTKVNCTGVTTKKGKDGQVEALIKATYKSWLTPNKCGYNDEYALRGK